MVNSVCLPAKQGVFSGRKRVNVEHVTKTAVFGSAHENDPEGAISEHPVVDTFENGLQNIVRLDLRVVESGTEFFVRTSVGHRIYLLGHGFEHAQDIPIGAKMRNYNGKVVELLAKTIEPEPELVYNFEVEDCHTYFVGDDAECCVLGHNQDCGPRKPPNCGSDIDAVNKALSQGEGKLNAFNSYLDNQNLKNKLRASEDLQDIKEKAAEEIAVNAAGWGLGKTLAMLGAFFRRRKIISRGAEAAADAAAQAGKHADEVANAYKIAKNGGKHANFFNQYEKLPNDQVNKGIESLKKQIKIHKDKIQNPEKAIPNFKDLDPRQQEALINKKWPSDIERQQEQLSILESIIMNRNSPPSQIAPK